jgi:HD-GYP domain-containing protein (c-di-GMP phosphodiesterase class II)
VAALTVGLAEAVSGLGVGVYRDLVFTSDQLKELRYAALLHDFGKVGVREHVLTKEKKLYPSQVDAIKARFEFAQRSVQLLQTADKLDLTLAGQASPEAYEEIDRRLAEELAQVEQWLTAVLEANEPSVLDEDKASMLEFLAQRRYTDVHGLPHPLLEPDELHFLSIRRGTLDDKERLEIESHVTHSYRFLTKIPWTAAMRNVPLIAYGHHEKLDGSGYPRHLTGPDIPVQARMMTICDIFDALTATDRPYKRAVPIERALAILESEAKDKKLDPSLLDVFISKRIYELAASYRPDEELLLGGPAR